MSDTWTTLRVLNWTTERFSQAGVDCARLDAQVLLAHVLDTDRVGLYTQFEKPLREHELGAYRNLIRRRLEGTPVAYLVGAKEFWSTRLCVDERVLVPRADTETLVQVALEVARQEQKTCIAEIATGSGAVAIALAKELPEARVVATDVSTDALCVAETNVSACHLRDRIELAHGDLLDPLRGRRFELLVANLPYVASVDIDELAPEVQMEPRLALDGGSDGLRVLERLIHGVAAVMEDNGVVCLEHGHDQTEAVQGLARDCGASEITSHRDLAQNDRVTRFRICHNDGLGQSN